MVNLRQSITTFRKKGKDGVASSSASPSTKFRKSVMGLSPTAGTSNNHKRTSSLGMFNKKDQTDPNDLSSHIGEIKVTVSQDKAPGSFNQKMFGSLQGFTVEEEADDIVVEDDLARKTDLKLQERREQRRKRQEELQKQLQLKMHSSADNTNPSLQDDNDDFPTSLPLHFGSSDEAVDAKPRVVAGRKSAAIRNRRAGAGETDRTSRVPGQSQQSPGRRMPRKSRMLENTDRTGVRPGPLNNKETSAEHGGKVGTEEEVPLVDRSSTRELIRKSRRKDDGVVGDANRDLGQVAQQSGLRRERRKTEFAMRSNERGDTSSSSPGALSTGRRSSGGAARNKAEIRGRQRQSVRSVKDMPELLGDTAGNDASLRSGGHSSSMDDSLRSTGHNKPKLGSWDEDNEQRGLSTQSEHRTSRRKRREKMEAADRSSLHQSEHGGKGRVARRSDRLSPKAARRQTIAIGRDSRHKQADSPQSETRRLRKDSRRERRESETLRTTRSIDDDLIKKNLKAAKEKSNGVRFKEDVKVKSAGQNTGERRKTMQTEGKQKAPGSPNKKKSPKTSPKFLSSKGPKSSEGVNSPPIWDDEYGAKDTSTKKKEAPSWALENADVYAPLKSDGKRSSKMSSSVLESMEEASESQHDFDYQEESRNLHPNVESGDVWMEPLSTGEIPPQPVSNEEVAKTDTRDGSKSPKTKSEKAESKTNGKNGEEGIAGEKQDEVVDENASASSGEYSSDESEETPEIPNEVPIKDDYSKRVSVLPMHGVSSSEEEEGEESDSSSSSEESEPAGEIPAVVSVGSIGADEISDTISSVGSIDSDYDRGETGDELEVEQSNPYEEQILPSSFRGEKRSIDQTDDIPPPPPSYPPPVAPEGKTNGSKTKTNGNDEGKFDEMFSNELTALEGTLQDMGDLAQPTPVQGSFKKHAQGPSSQPVDYKFLVDILGVIAPLSSEQKAMLQRDPVAREKVVAAIAEEEQRNRQQMLQKVRLLESKLSTVQKDLEKEQLESAAHKMQVATQDLVIIDYKASLETLTKQCESLEKEKDAAALKSREQEEKTSKMKESLEETQQLVKEQQMFMNAQQRQMQTMETKISALQESNKREESKTSMQNEKLRDIIRIQKETIMKALGNQEQTETYET